MSGSASARARRVLRALLVGTVAVLALGSCGSAGRGGISQAFWAPSSAAGADASPVELTKDADGTYVVPSRTDGTLYFVPVGRLGNDASWTCFVTWAGGQGASSPVVVPGTSLTAISFRLPGGGLKAGVSDGKGVCKGVETYVPYPGAGVKLFREVVVSLGSGGPAGVLGPDFRIRSSSTAPTPTPSPSGSPSSPSPSPVAGFSASPNPLEFGEVQVGVHGPSRSVTVTNTGGALLAINTVTVTGANAGDFEITSNGCIGAVAPGATCEVAVSFVAMAAGDRSATLSFGTTVGSKSVPMSGIAFP